MNGTGYDSGMPTMAALGDLPILQDTAAVDAWGSWGVTYRDVVVLDANNEVVGVFNLTSNSLSDPANYAALKNMLTGAVVP